MPNTPVLCAPVIISGLLTRVILKLALESVVRTTKIYYRCPVYQNMDSDISTVFDEYIEASARLATLRKQQLVIKKSLTVFENKIKEYMTENTLDSVSLKNGQVIMYDRKVSETFKKDAIVETLKTHLGNSQKAEAVAESILSNKVFSVRSALKVKPK
jgi:hypothetical protein